MSKKLKDMKWESVSVGGFPASAINNLEGFVGLEECTSYGLAIEPKKSKKKTQEKKRKSSSSQEVAVPNKRVKLSNGFVVETCNIAKPSKANSLSNAPSNINNETETKKKKQKKKKNKKQSQDSETVIKPVTDNKIKQTKESNVNQKNKVKLGESALECSQLTPEDMLSWAEFKLPEPIIKAMMELGFKNPTQIQQLSLPAAIHGRRDILGAAETGSGKTLAFGLPILSGIMKLKEKAEAKGLDVYDIPYKKNSNKKKVKNIEPIKKGKKNTKNKKSDVKESSEDGYSSGDEIGDETNEINDEIVEPKPEKVKSNTKLKNKKQKEIIDKKLEQLVKIDENGEKYLEEIEVPVRKRRASPDEGNNSDDSENFIHLSDMLDSDDLADNSSDDDSQESGEENGTDGSDDENSGEENESDGSGDDIDMETNESSDEQNDDESDASDIENEELPSDESDGEIDQADGQVIGSGMGCVKVIDNIQLPQPATIKTGKPLYALILTPTRELAVQISRHLTAVAKYTGIRIATIVGGMASVKQERVLLGGPEVVVATPGRLYELSPHPHLQQLSSVKFLAIDETDRMIERGHFEELQPILERCNLDEAQRSARQNFVFSATLTMVHDLPKHCTGKKVTKRGKIINRKVQKMTAQQKIKRLIDMIGMTNPKVVDITTQNLGTAETLTESRITCSLDQKDMYLYYILKRHPGRTIVFCNSINSVRRLAQLFTLLKSKPLPLHAGMIQRQRLKNLERFRDDPYGVLIATDVAARGLDVPDVDHVIHYQVPRTAENYVHRSGRTARATKEGLTILMMDPSEAYLYTKLCKTLNKTSELPIFPVAAEALPSIRDLMTLARELEGLELKKRRQTQESGWREKVAREMDIILDEDNAPTKYADPSLDKALKVKRKGLEALLTRPLFPRGFSFKFPTLNDPAALQPKQENALQVMKNAIESGSLKKEKRTSKNASLFKLEKEFQKNKKAK